ncbi:4-alpha-glucanotransferase [Haloarchaeobius sp. DYHT-AS-18]|uniref:4-alpha-glucanotransferase n=1 Tax=Haloarchaeobius sp. DYHT-AS-18 TaxID=3446117 RepID=UPI003EB83BB9
MTQRFDRQSGVFLHVSALPGEGGIGTLGEPAEAFVDFLADAEQSLWQICPLGPVSGAHGNSPYQSPSAFAGNPLLIDLDRLLEAGWLDESDLDSVPDLGQDQVDYDAVREYKLPLLRTAFENFESRADEADREALADFREDQHWLDDYTLFVALKERFDGSLWTEWPEEYRMRDEDALADAREEHADEIRYHALVQYWFYDQWHELKSYANDRGVDLLGDLPIYVALDSADVWANPDSFQLDEQNRPVAVAGVPPSGDDGQKWGNPLYDWETLAEDDYEWWVDRLSGLLELVDIVRIDHVKGFDSYYAIPVDGGPADGHWEDAPGHDLFETVEAELGDLPFVAEDLGFPDPELTALLERFDFPGMKVSYYANWCEEDHEFLPHTYPENTVGYTTTHDTGTALGLYDSLAEEDRGCMEHYLESGREDVQWALIDAVWKSDSVIAIAPMQDVLGLDDWARFNTPGTAEGNWDWRTRYEHFHEDVSGRLADVTRNRGRGRD